MRRLPGSLVSSRLVLVPALLAATAGAQNMLEVYDTTLTTYQPTVTSKVNDLRPLHVQRGVNIDGSLRAAPAFRMATQANPYENAFTGGQMDGGVRQDIGAYAPLDVDIALPTKGPVWTIGRSYNSRQENSGGTAIDSSSAQGVNWMQTSQMEIVFFAGSSAADDVVYLLYRADAYLEFRRDGSSSNDFKGKNGAAGAIKYVSGSPETYVYTDQVGTEFTFFGFNTASNKADGQLWTIVDADGNKAYVGDDTTASTAVTNGYDSAGHVLNAFDASGRRFSYSYSTLDSVTRLTQVKAETKTGGTWSSPTGLKTVEKVDYAYYSSENGGDVGDLKKVTITTRLNDSTGETDELTKKKYYRYYEGTYNSTSNPGYPHEVKLVLDFEGCRSFDWQDSNLSDEDFADTANQSDATLKPFAAGYFEYDTSRRVNKAFANGACGCSGAISGTHEYTYETLGSYSDTTGYQTGWARRTVLRNPDGHYVTQYFDETNQGLSSVVTDINPGSSSPTPKKWVTFVERDASGLVTTIGTPASVSSYTHDSSGPSGAISLSSSAGLIWTYTRLTSGNATGFASERKFKEGSSGTAYYSEAYTYDTSELTKALNTVTIRRPVLATHRVYPTASTTVGSGYEETTYTPVAYTVSGTHLLAVETMTTTPPAVSVGNNGAGTSTTVPESVHYRKDGLVDFKKLFIDPTGTPSFTIEYSEYTDGQITKLIEDSDTSSTDISGGVPSGFAKDSSSAQAHRVQVFAYTSAGMSRSATKPGDNSTDIGKTYRTRLADQRLATINYPAYKPSTATYYGPATFTIANQDGRTEASGTIAYSGGSTTAGDDSHVNEAQSDPLLVFSTGSVSSLTTNMYSEDGTRIEEVRNYFLLPTSGGVGTEGTNYDATRFGYDSLGRRVRTKDSSGTITRTVFNTPGGTVETWIGTNDNAFSGGESSGPDNMVKTTVLEYDSASDGGNGNLTSRTLRIQDGATGQSVTTYAYDYRGRILVETNPTSPHAFHKYNNLGRRIATAMMSDVGGSFNPSTADATAGTLTNRLALTESSYDELGRTWKTVRHKIDTADGSDDDSLETLTWYDYRGRVAKVDGEELGKTKYDRLDRATDAFVLAKDDDTTYADTLTVTGDFVLEQRETRFDATSGNVNLRVGVSRLHSDYGTGTPATWTLGALDTNADTNDFVVTMGTSGDVKGRASITARYYDALDRVVDSVEYGTYAETTFTLPSSPATRSDDALRTTTTYNDDGTLKSIEDPRGLKTLWTYDALGRQLSEVKNWDGTSSPSPTYDSSGIVGSVTNAQNVTVKYEYSNGLRTKLIADNPGTGDDQETLYIYGTVKGTPSANVIATGNLLRAVKYPDSTNTGTTTTYINGTSDADVVSYVYDAQGREISKKDQAGNVIDTEYDTGGRTTAKKVSTLASGFDGAVRRIDTAYDSLGRTLTVTQKDAVTSGSITDEVKYTYEGWGNVEEFEQDKNSAVGASGSVDDYEVSYAYAKQTTGRNTTRRTSMTLPSGKAITYTYLTRGGLVDNPASRVTEVKDAAVVLAAYDYLGSDQVVGVDYQEADISQKFYETGSGYPDLDRFSRVVKSRWTKELSPNVDFYHVELTYDRDSNITSAEDSVHGGFDVIYTMDNTNRVVRAEEGTISSGSITSRTRDQQWTLSPTGNWKRDKVDLNGDADFVDTDEVNDTRGHNKVNELETRDTDSNSSTNYSLTYDAAGNQTDDGKDYKYEYDAFYRLRKIRKTASPYDLVAEYRYNGLGFKIAEHADTDTDGDVDANDKWYYDAFDEQWRQVSRFRESDPKPKEEFVAHAAGAGGHGASSYIDQVICRYKDANTAWTSASDEVLEERLYYCQNQHADVVAIVDPLEGLKEWVKYSAYGVPFGMPAGDVDSDGDCDQSDIDAIQQMIWLLQYDVRGDVDLSGALETSDKATLNSTYKGTTLGRSHLSSNVVANGRGMEGYAAMSPL
ncbi:MAG: RHS repeat protein, partial [Chloroflexi bacterium]|nr:RHS repeat protein [Chloroflexota bacterium]